MNLDKAGSEKPTAKAALVLIDIQEGFSDPYWGQRNNPGAEENAAMLLNVWRLAKRPVFHVQHLSCEPNSPLRPELPGSAIKTIVEPMQGELLFQKNVNSAFIGTNLEKALRDARIEELVIAGLTTDHCVSTSVRMAANLGFRVWLVQDSCATFAKTGPDGRTWSAEDLHWSALASLHGEFASVVNMQDLLTKP